MKYTYIRYQFSFTSPIIDRSAMWLRRNVYHKKLLNARSHIILDILSPTRKNPIANIHFECVRMALCRMLRDGEMREKNARKLIICHNLWLSREFRNPIIQFYCSLARVYISFNHRLWQFHSRSLYRSSIQSSPSLFMSHIFLLH